MERSELALADGLINQIDYAKATDALAISKLEYEHAVQSARLQQQTLAHTIRNTEKTALSASSSS